MNTTTLGRAAIAADDPAHAFPAAAECISGRQHVSAYLMPLAKSSKLRQVIRSDTRVLHVGRGDLLKGDHTGDLRRGQHSFRILVRDPKAERMEEADVVLDCTGTYGQHRWLGAGGIPALGELQAEPQLAYGLEDVLGERRSAFAGKYTLVVGAGYSAATTVCNLAALAQDDPGTWVIWLCRGSSTQPIRRITNDSLRERDRLAVRANTLATRSDGNLEFHKHSVVEAVEGGADKGFKVSARCEGKARVWEVDRVIANVGYTPDTSLYRELQIHECYASLGPMKLAAALLKHGGVDCLTVPAPAGESLRNPEPDFYVLGAKSYGRNSNYLLRTGFAQVREVFRLIAGRPDLDLYEEH